MVLPLPEGVSLIPLLNALEVSAGLLGIVDEWPGPVLRRKNGACQERNNKG